MFEQKETRITDLENTFHFLHQHEIHLTLCRQKTQIYTFLKKALNSHRIFSSRKLQQFQVLHFKNKCFWWEGKEVYTLYSKSSERKGIMNCLRIVQKRKKKGFARSEARKIVLCMEYRVFLLESRSCRRKRENGWNKYKESRKRVNWKCYIEMKLL